MRSVCCGESGERKRGVRAQKAEWLFCADTPPVLRRGAELCAECGLGERPVVSPPASKAECGTPSRASQEAATPRWSRRIGTVLSRRRVVTVGVAGDSLATVCPHRGERVGSAKPSPSRVPPAGAAADAPAGRGGPLNLRCGGCRRLVVECSLSPQKRRPSFVDHQSLFFQNHRASHGLLFTDLL